MKMMAHCSHWSKEVHLLLITKELSRCKHQDMEIISTSLKSLLEAWASATTTYHRWRSRYRQTIEFPADDCGPPSQSFPRTHPVKHCGGYDDFSDLLKCPGSKGKNSAKLRPLHTLASSCYVDESSWSYCRFRHLTSQVGIQLQLSPASQCHQAVHRLNMYELESADHTPLI